MVLTRSAALSVLLLAAGCSSKTMTSDDCRRVGAHIRKVWDTDAEKAAPEKGPRSERAMNAIKSEGDRIETEWRSTCERELEGRKVDPQEVDCVLGATTSAELQKCGVTRK